MTHNFASAVGILVALTSSQAAPQRSSEPRIITFHAGTPLQDRVEANDRVVVIEKVGSPPPIPLDQNPTLDQEINRLVGIADAVVVLRVDDVNAHLVSAQDWIATDVRTTVKQFVRAANASMTSQRQLSFSFDGGEMRIGPAQVKAGSYPIFRVGASYLMMFRVDSRKWYPFMPLLIDGSRLRQAEEFQPHPMLYANPLYGQSLKKVIGLFQRTIGH